jgi:nucleoside-diphosphate-sugar epimerase
MSADRKLGRVALTGAPGWLANTLLDAFGCESGVAEVDALMHPAAWSRNPLSVHSRIDRSFPYDLADVNADARPALEGVDTLIHSAGVIHVRHTREWYDINTKGTIRLAQAAQDAGVGRFIFISSNASAGRSVSGDHILSETDVPKPLSHYGRSKLLAEQGLAALHEADVFEVVVLRPSMFYGPPVPQRHIEVYRRIRDGRFPIVGSGRYLRSLTYIDHLVQAVMLAGTRSQASGQAYYVADQRVYTTVEICEAIAGALGVPLKRLRLPAAIGPMAYSADCILSSMGLYWQTLHLLGESDWHVGTSCEKLQRELGYSPTVDLQEGMKRAVDWCKQNGRL